MNHANSRERARQFHASYHGRHAQRSLQQPTAQHHTDGFKTPEVVASAEEQHPSTNTAGPLVKPKKTFKSRLRSITKKQWIIIGVAAFLVLGGLTTWLLWPSKEPVKVQVVADPEAPPPAPTTVASNLTGLQVDPSVNGRPVTGIMIENSLDARPQSSLSQAGVVFEAIAEGGITRFLTLWQDTEPDYIGPVRSVRPYYLQWTLGFDAPIAHVGGSADALVLIKRWGVKDLDQFANSKAYWRIPSRAAPHNVYTSIANLRAVETSKGWTSSAYTGFARAEAESPIAVPTARTIDLNISSANYNVHYDYDPTTNSYKRSEGGKAHVDERTNAQLTPKVIVVPIMAQGSNGKYTTYETLGTGPVYVFQNGSVVQGNWRKENNNANFVFTYPDGSPLKLIPGQTWVTVVGAASRITYAP